jgi:hypothetical protein
MNHPGLATFLPNFDDLGVDGVRDQLEAGSWPLVTRKAATKWLTTHERDSRASMAVRNAAVADAQIRAANATESQAISARRALWVAVAAALMAVISLVVSVIALHGHH